MAVELTPDEARRLGVAVPKGTRTKARPSRAGAGEGTPFAARCAGIDGCGRTATATLAEHFRHFDLEHGGHGRLEVVHDPQP